MNQPPGENQKDDAPPPADIQDGMDLRVDASPKEASDLENRIYDGLPPLSVMIEMRRRRGTPSYDDDELHRRYSMTEDDWKALAAFEKALHASVALRTACWLGTAAFLCNGLVIFNLNSTEASPSRHIHTTLALGFIVLEPTLLAGVLLLRDGADRLARVNLGIALDLAPVSAGLIVLVLGVLAFVNGVFFFELMAPVAGLGLLASALALIAASVATVHAWIALRSIRPPEIAHRLVEALKYLV